MWLNYLFLSLVFKEGLGACRALRRLQGKEYRLGIYSAEEEKTWPQLASIISGKQAGLKSSQQWKQQSDRE